MAEDLKNKTDFVLNLFYDFMCSNQYWQWALCSSLQAAISSIRVLVFQLSDRMMPKQKLLDDC